MTYRRGLVIAIVAGATLGLASCGGVISELRPDNDLHVFNSKASDVDFGMNKARVQYIMGVPRHRVYEGSQEAWLWCQTSTSPRLPDAYLTVYFHNAQVAGIHSYGNRAEGLCENFFKRVEWLADPEKSRAAKVRRRE